MTPVAQTIAFLGDQINQTIDNEVSRINLPESQLIGDPTRPGMQLIQKLETIVLFEHWMSENSPDIDSKVSALLDILTQINIAVKFLNDQTRTLNSNYTTSSAPPTVFQLKSKFVPQNISTVIPSIATAANTSMLLEDLTLRLPDVSSQLSTLNSTLLHMPELMNKHVTQPIRNAVALLTGPSGNTMNQSELWIGGLVANASRVVASANSSLQAVGNDLVKWDLIRQVTTSLLLSLVAIVLVVLVGAIAFSSEITVKIILPEIAVVCFFVLVFAGVLFTASVIVGEGCAAINDPNTVLISAISETVGTYVENFMKARKACLNRTVAGGLVDFVTDFGMNQKLTNLSDKVDPLIENADFSTFLKVNMSTNPGSGADVMSELNEVTSSISALQKLDFSGMEANLTALRMELQSLMNTPDQLVNSFAVVSGPSGLQYSDFSDVIKNLNDSVTAVDNAESAIRAFKSEMSSANSTLENLQNQIYIAEDSMGTINQTTAAVFNLTNAFVHAATANLTSRIQPIKSELYKAASDASQFLDESLDCQAIAFDSLAVEEKICVDFNDALDAMWLAFAIIGFALFCTICTVPWFVSHIRRRKRNGAGVFKKAKEDSSAVTVLNRELDSEFKISRGFGKEKPKCGSAKNASGDARMLEDSAGRPPGASDWTLAEVDDRGHGAAARSVDSIHTPNEQPTAPPPWWEEEAGRGGRFSS
ncbi:hypothetical protein HDU82_004599 [Entophlyctis luteolus]|nr:hypothetical protein HDU82_004599 [Entophlyctis luteolus]